MASSPLARNCGHFCSPPQRSPASRRPFRRRPPTKSVSAPRGSASYTVTKSVALPSVPAGNYFLLFRADHNGALYESDETNNGWTALPITVTNPDLAATAFSGPSTAEARETVSFSWTVANVSTITAYSSWTDSVYLSTDTTYGSGDTAVTSQSRSTAVAPAAGYSVTKTVTLPTTLAPGSYNLILWVDKNDSLAESNEGNNQVVVPFTIDP